MPTTSKTPTGSNRRFWNFRNAADGEAELLLYSDIADQTWFGDEVTPLQFVSDLRSAAAAANKITVRINSGGGDVFAANAIASNLRDTAAQGKEITCKIDGICASAAVIVAMAANKILIPSSGYMMIHKVQTMLMGRYTSDDLRDIAAENDKISEGVVNAYIARTGLDADTCEQMMNATTWMTGEEAVEQGFADELTDVDVDVEPSDEPDNPESGVIINGVKFRFAANANLPDDLRKRADDKSKGGTNMNEIKDADALRAAYPDLVNGIEGAARDAGTQAERARLRGVDSLTGIEPAYLAEAKYGAEALSPETAAFNALRDGKMVKPNPLAALAADRAGVNGVPGASEPAPLSEAERRKAYAEGVEARARAHFGKRGDK